MTTLGTIQSPAVVGNTLTQTKTITGLTVDAGANSVLAIIQFTVPFNWTNDLATTSVKYATVEMTKKYWSRAVVTGAGEYNTGYTLFAYLDSPATSGDLVIDWPSTQTNWSVAVTWIPINGAAIGDAKFGATARFEGATGTKTTLLQITPTVAGSWLFAAISRRDNTDGAITWTDSTLNSGEIREWTGSGNIEAGCGACAYRTSASLSAHDVGGAAAVDGGASDFRGSAACVELKAAVPQGVTPTFVAAGTASATTASQITPAYPASIAAGDLFILHCVGQGQTTNLPTVSAPSGWSTLYSSEGANNQAKQWIFKRDARATGSETGTLAVDCTTPGTNGVVAGAIYAFRNVTPVATITEGSNITTGTSTSIGPPAVTAGNARLCCAFVGVGGNQTPASFTGETGGDWVVRNTAAGATGDGYCIQLQTANVSDATITGGATTITSDDWVARAFALLPFAAVSANSLADQAPVLGQPRITRNFLTATSLADAAPTLGQSTLHQKYALIANSLGNANTFDDGTIFDDGTSWIDTQMSPILDRPAINALSSLAASSLADAAPTLGQSTVGQKHALAATNIADRAPLVGQPGIGQKHALTAANLADRAPLVGQPVIGQKHVLTSTALSDRQPLLAQPVMVVKRNLAATSLADRQPLVGQPVVGQKHALVATALGDRQPILGQPVMGVTRNLVASSLADRQPIVAQPAMGVTRNLVASSLADRQPLLAQPTVGQKHVLAATALADRQPVLGQPIPASAGQFTPLPLVDQPPLLGTPVAGQKHALAAISLADRQPLLTAPTVGQKHALAATALSDRQPSVGQPVMAVTRNLVASSLADRAPLVAQPGVGQKHALAAAALVGAAPILVHPVVGQAGIITASDLASARPVLAFPTIHQTHVLGATALVAAAPVLGQPAATQGHHLAATGLIGAALLGHASLTIGIFGLAANGLRSRPGVLGQPASSQKHVLAAANYDGASLLLGAPVLESFLPGVFIANNLVAQPVILGSPKVNWRELSVIRFGVTNKQAKVDTFGARPAYAAAGSGVSSATQFGALAPSAPAAVAPGELLIWVALAIDSEPSNVTPPVGYVTLQGSPFGTDASPYAPRLHVALKPADGSEAGNPQGFNYVLASGDVTRRSISARVFRITAADGFVTSLVEGVTTSEGVGTITCPTVTPAGINRLGLLVTAINADVDVASALGSINGTWQQAAPEYRNTTGGDCTLDLQWAALTAAPISGGQIAASATWVCVGFALAPPRTAIDFASAGVLIEDRTPALAVAVNG